MSIEEDARRYNWLKENMSERHSAVSARAEYGGVKLEHVFPQLNRWADFCGEITLDDAIDIETGHFDE